MEKFIVISLHLGGLKNRRFKSGDVVSQSDFSEPVVNLVEKKYLKPLVSEDEKATVELLRIRLHSEFSAITCEEAFVGAAIEH